MLSLHAKNVGTVAVLSLQGQIVTGETQALRSAVQSLPEVRRNQTRFGPGHYDRRRRVGSNVGIT